MLYVGCYRDSTGWGNAAIGYLRSLHAAGVDVAARPLKLNSNSASVPDEVRQMEANDFREYDAVIQHVLPHHSWYDGRYKKNILLYAVETMGFISSVWPSYINTMDYAIVPCNHNSRSSQKSGVKVPIEIIPHACDTSIYERKWEPLSLRSKLAGNFVFYWIGEFIHRKNIAALIRAFHGEFDRSESVSLVIKVSPKGGKAYETEANLRKYINEIKSGLKLYPTPEHYKEEILLVGRYSDEEVMRLHASCDCMVATSSGEAWGIPVFDAMAMGKTPVYPDYGGYTDYLDVETGWPVRVTEEPAFFTHRDTFHDLQTGRDEWGTIDVSDLRRKMREACDSPVVRKELADNGMDRAYDFSYSKVGRRMREALAT